MTRSEYMASLPKYGTPESEAHHRAYYSQFITPAVKARVLAAFTRDELRAAFALDPHFNSIPLGEWDKLSTNKLSTIHHAGGGMSCNYLPADARALMRKAGEGNSASSGVCVTKEAARQIAEETQE
jgi:hypothetical protein